jgi:colanic acid biosynthesis protein WcaH
MKKPTADRVPKLTTGEFLEAIRRMPLVSFDLLVRDEAGRLLLGCRKNEPARGSWFVPGGIIRKGETLQEAFARITRDELGHSMLLSEARLKGVYEHFYEENAAEVEGISTHYIVLAYELVWRNSTASLPFDQHEDYGWFSEQEIVDHPQVHANTKAYCR